MAVVREIRISETDRIVAEEVAESIVQSIERKLPGLFRVALSGGATPKQLYERLVSDDYAARVPWSRVEFYFGDERCVPRDHPESNFHLADQGLFRPLGIHSKQIFRIVGEDPHPDQAASRYEEMLRERFSAPAPLWPRFDLILLGLGQDGHTASLFPGAPALREQARGVVDSESPRGVVHRVTFTAPLINHAHRIVVTVTGKEKAPAVHAVLEDKTTDVNRYPAKLIQPVDGQCLWCLDRAAASLLTTTTRTSNP